MIEPEREDRPTASALTARRVAFFGGSFDPPHLGHLAVARAARAAFQLDSVLFAPVGAQPLKPQGSTAGFDDRVEMTKLAIEGEPGFHLSLADAPNANGEPNFTLETLLGLRAELAPGSKLYCLMGADSFWGLRRWHRAAEIPFAAPLIVAYRPGEPMNELRAALPEGLNLESGHSRDESGVEVREFRLANAATGQHAPFYVLPGLHVDISASEVREAIRAGISGMREMKALRLLVPAAVAEYVRAHHLYG